MLSFNLFYSDEDDDMNESINNYKDIFEEYINNPPSLNESLKQLFKAGGIKDEKLDYYIGYIIKNCKNIYENNCNQIKKLKPEITEEESYIISAYTCQIQKEKDLSPYVILNSNLVSKNRKKGIDKVSKYFYLLLSTLRKLKRTKVTTLFRAIPEKKEKPDIIDKTFWSFTSTSPDLDISKNFLSKKKEGTFFVIGGNTWGYDITLFNCFKEKEILLEPERHYKITGYQNKNTYIQIDCELEDDRDLVLKFIEEKNMPILTQEKSKENDKPIEKIKNPNKAFKFCFLIETLLALFFVCFSLYYFFISKFFLPKKTIIGIDFGSSFTRFAIIEDSDYNGFYFNDENTKSELIESRIIIARQEFSAISIGKTIYYINNFDKEKKLLFYNIKKNLDPKIFKTTIKSNFPLDGEAPLESILLAYFEKLKKNYIDNNEIIKNKALKEIKWIISVPPLWDERSKKLMKKIACKSLLNENSFEKVKEDQLQLVLEPEAASLAIVYDKNIQNKLKKGKTFLLIDAGGYTVDFSINEIIDKNNNLRQLSIPKSFTFGSNSINEEIVDIIEFIYGKDKINFIKNNSYSEWEKILYTIENKKKSLNAIGGESMKLDINLNIGPSCWSCLFQNIYTNCLCKKKYNNVEITYDKQAINIPISYINSIIYKLASNITEEINKVFKDFKGNIDLIIITGGFSKNDILMANIKNSFKDSERDEPIFLESPQETVMKGAAIFGVLQSQIKERIIPITIGINSFETKNNEEYINYIIIINKGDIIKTNENKQTEVYINSEKISIYYSKKEKDDNKKLLKEINIPNEEYLKKEKVTVFMKFSNYISACIYDKNNNECQWEYFDYP